MIFIFGCLYSDSAFNAQLLKELRMMALLRQVADPGTGEFRRFLDEVLGPDDDIVLIVMGNGWIRQVECSPDGACKSLTPKGGRIAVTDLPRLLAAHHGRVGCLAIEIDRILRFSLQRFTRTWIDRAELGPDALELLLAVLGTRARSS